MEPVRTCVGCRQRAPQPDLIRLVRCGDEIVDATHPRLEGRGAYLHPNGRCLALADKRRALPRVFGAAAVLNPDVIAVLGAAPGWIDRYPGE